MSRLVKWNNEVGDNSQSDNRIEYMKLVPSVKHVIRPVGFPVEFWKFFNRTDDGMRIAITDDPQILQRYDLEPSRRYAINVIDRADGQLKVLEFPYTIYQSLCKYKEMTNEDPGGNNGADFSILKTGSGKKGTKYEVKKVKETKFTREEAAMIKDKGLYKLPELFKAVPADKIEGVLFGEDEDTPDPDLELGEDKQDVVDDTVNDEDLKF